MSRIVLVTGASTGIGRRIAGLLATSGFHVFGTSRRPTSDTLDNFAMLPLDVTSDESVSTCVARLIDRVGCIDVLINNAGVDHVGAVEESSIDEARSVFETNVYGVMRVTRAVLPHMRAARNGLIINISSIAGLGGAPFQGIYSASKGALENLSEALWYEAGCFGIRVALVEPGFFRTEINARKTSAAQTIPDYDPYREKVMRKWNLYLDEGPDPLPVAQTVLAIAQGKRRGLRHRVGREGRLTRIKFLVPDWLVRLRMHWWFGLSEIPAFVPDVYLRWLGIRR